MEFWGVEVKSGEKVLVPPKDDKTLHLSQACLGQVKKDKGNLSVYINLHVGDQKFVLGTLSPEKFPQLSFDLMMEKEFVLSHNWKNGSVYFNGYRVPGQAEQVSTSCDSDPDSDLGEPLPRNGKSMIQAKENKPSSSRANAMKRDSDTSDDSDESSVFESDNDDEALPAEDKIENVKDDESDDSDDSDGSDECDEEDEDTPKKAVPSQKRKADSSTKSPLPDKKAKLVTPQKSDGGKKNVVHVDTPYPKQTGKTANNEKSKQQATNLATPFKCNPCNRTFTSDVGLQSHTKAKHSATK